MKIYQQNKKIKYRNGQNGFLLTSSRPETNFSVLTMCEKRGSLFHHDKEGKYLGMSEEMPWDIVEVEK
jgi:hypothetical protein